MFIILEIITFFCIPFKLGNNGDFLTLLPHQEKEMKSFHISSVMADTKSDHEEA